jgi:tRNA dimethylallyltransferase
LRYEEVYLMTTEKEGKPRLLALLGPTAAGKTELSLRLAEKLDAELISCDSMCVYRGMDIGTAKPTEAERSRVPHHMIDIADPDEQFTVADYKERVEELILDLNARGKLPMLVGGTGLYLRAVVQDYPMINVPPDPELREKLRAEAEATSREALHEQLAEVDPRAAEKIHHNDLKRVVRALEVFEKTGKPISRAQEETTAESPYDSLKIGLEVPRDVLYERINRRVDEMLEDGLLEEVRALLDSGYSRDLYSMQSLGYRELAAYLADEHDLEEAVRLIKRNTRHFARRQLIWFRKEKNVNWVQTHDTSGEFRGVNGLEEEILDLVAGNWPDVLNKRH